MSATIPQKPQGVKSLGTGSPGTAWRPRGEAGLLNRRVDPDGHQRLDGSEGISDRMPSCPRTVVKRLGGVNPLHVSGQWSSAHRPAPRAQPRYPARMKRIGFLSFGHWSDSPYSAVRSGSDALLQSIDLAVAAEELGADGAFFRVHHFARQLASPFPLLAAIGARTSGSTSAPA